MSFFLNWLKQSKVSLLLLSFNRPVNLLHILSSISNVYYWILPLEILLPLKDWNNNDSQQWIGHRNPWKWCIFCAFAEVQAAGNTYGTYFRVTTFGESHGGGVGCIIDGCPPRIPLSESDMQVDLDRRYPFIVILSYYSE